MFLSTIQAYLTKAQAQDSFVMSGTASSTAISELPSFVRARMTILVDFLLLD
jgi:hypothetical protein